MLVVGSQVWRPFVALLIATLLAGAVGPREVNARPGESSTQVPPATPATGLQAVSRPGGSSVSALGAPGDAPPAAPTGMSATPSNNRVSLAWNTVPEPDLAGYNVYRDVGPPLATVSAVAAGDIASCSSSGDEATAALLDTLSGDVLALGDTVYESGTPAEYTNCYNPTWGRAKTRTRPARATTSTTPPTPPAISRYFGSAAGEPARATTATTSVRGTLSCSTPETAP